MNFTLNTLQKTVLLLGALAIIGVSCYPPWIRVNRNFAEQPAGTRSFSVRPIPRPTRFLRKRRWRTGSTASG